jgi:hypothetical protein
MSACTDLGTYTFFLILCFVLFVLALIEYLEATATDSSFNTQQTQVATGILAVSLILLFIAIVRFVIGATNYWHKEKEAEEALKKKQV